MVGPQVPDSMPTCGQFEPGWGLVCHREPEHRGRCYGANVAGTHEGFWGAGLLRVVRIPKKEGVS